MLSNKGDTERRIACPYEPSHILLHYRMQSHLVKCRRNHPDSKKATCLFNSTHQVPDPELNYHHEICPDRGNLDKHLVVVEKTNPEKYLLPEVKIDPQDNWDDEPPRPTYDPEVYCQNNAILRNTIIQTQSQAVRRNFRMEERQRMQGIMNQQQSTAGAKSNKQKAVQRRPVGASEGIQNRAEISENDPFDVEDLLARVNLGSSTLTTPRLGASNPIENEINNDNETEPVRGTGAVPRRPMPAQTVCWGPKRKQGGTASVNPFRDADFPELSRGRGSRFTKK